VVIEILLQILFDTSLSDPTIARKSPGEPPTGRCFFVNQRVTLLEISILERLSSRKRGNLGTQKDRAAESGPVWKFL
jgi:hypothetical protein